MRYRDRRQYWRRLCRRRWRPGRRHRPCHTLRPAYRPDLYRRGCCVLLPRKPPCRRYPQVPAPLLQPRPGVPFRRREARKRRPLSRQDPDPGYCCRKVPCRQVVPWRKGPRACPCSGRGPPFDDCFHRNVAIALSLPRPGNTPENPLPVNNARLPRRRPK